MIIDQHSDSPEDLKSCALVCKAWAPASRRNLFATTMLESQEELCKWSIIFAPTSIPDTSISLPNPSHLVSTLRIRAQWKNPAKDLTLFIPFLRSFTRVKKLIFLGLNFMNASHLQFPQLHFAHFVLSLRTLVLVCTDATDCIALIRFVCMFPHLDDLSIRGLFCTTKPCHCRDCTSHRPVAPLPPPTFRGRLEITGLLDAIDFVHEMAALPLKFSSCKLLQMSPVDFGHWMELLSSCATTLKTLEVSLRR